MPAPTTIEKGTKFGMLTFVRWVNGTYPRKAVFKCDCGNEKIAIVSNVKRGLTRSCGCLTRSSSVNVGDIFGSWEVIEVGHFVVHGNKKHSASLCRCTCGSEVERIVLNSHLINGRSKSCGSRLFHKPNRKPAEHNPRMCYGYRYVYHPEHPSSLKTGANKGFVMEHRYVMEKHIGRLLTDDECVHHKDHNKTNNVLDNLELMTNSAHSKLHGKERHIGHEHHCIVCGSEIPCTQVKKCKECIEKEKEFKRKRFEDVEKFAKQLETTSFEELGRQYGMTGNAIKKAAIRLGIKFTPHTARFAIPPKLDSERKKIATEKMVKTCSEKGIYERLAKLNKKRVARIAPDGTIEKIYDGVIDVEQDGFGSQHVGRCCRNSNYTCKGYHWKYV